MVIPFLGILFGTQEKTYQAPTLTLDASSIKENFYFLISKTIDEKGNVEVPLLLICILVLAMFFLKIYSDT